MPNICTAALALLDGHISRTLKLTWDMYSRYQKKAIYFERAYFREYENANARHVCPCNTPSIHPKPYPLKIDLGYVF